jgi:TolA-binding protein
LKIKIQHISFLLIVLSIGCSTKKNTVLTRTYHNITSRYNVYFNGKESYKKGLKRMNSELKNDYTSVLPVFPFPTTEVTSTSNAEMDRTIKKASKVIAVHSITAKPEFKRGIRTKRDKNLYNKKQYNKWIDDAYLLMGKASLMKGDYMSATGAFRYILKEFPNENTYDETQIWLAKTLIIKEEYSEAEEILSHLADNKKLSKKLQSFLHATYADYYIHKKRFNDAIPELETAADKARDKQSRLRYTFILGQLYQSTGQMAKATNKYLKVIKMSPPYEMTFNARVNLAGSYESGQSGIEKIRKELYKLLNDEKNKEYQDQIYFALANLDMKENNIDKALINYGLSVEKSVSNQRQKSKSYLAMADIKYNQKDYLNAQAYYDSVMTNIDENFSDYNRISSRAKSLKRLADNLNTVSFEDSVQFIAKMSDNERNMFIDKIIAQLKEKEAEVKRKQQEEYLEQQQNFAGAEEMEQRDITSQNSTGGKWYFYNPSSKSFGQTEFKLKWGNRKLEDNWRRNIKKSLLISENLDEESEDNDSRLNVKKKNLSNKSREYYTANLPTNDSLMDISNRRIRKSLYASGIIYKDDLSEYKLSAKQFDELISRFPTDPISAEGLYQLYILYRQMDNISKAEGYKSILLSNFPESNYSKLLTNPNFIKELQERENAVGNLYESAYLDYNAGNFSSSMAKANEGIANYPNHKLASKFLLIKALSTGKLSNIESLRKELNELIKLYPKSEEASASKDIIALMDTKHPEVKEAEDKVIAKEIYKPAAENDKHFFAIVVQSKKADQNQLVFNLINYNLDNYTNANLTVKADNLSTNSQIVVVREFNSKTEAMNYFYAVKKATSIFKDVGTGILATFIISQANMTTLKQDGSESRYMKFFTDNYAHQIDYKQ